MLMLHFLPRYLNAVSMGQQVISILSLRNHLVTKYLNIIPVSRNGKEGTVQKINNFIDNSEENLLIAPDGCDYIQEKTLIAPFKKSIFIIQMIFFFFYT